MLKAKFSVSFLFLLLLILLSNAVLLGQFNAPHRKVQVIGINNAAHKISPATHINIKPALVNRYVKVRYIGADCTFDPTPLYIDRSVTPFIEQPVTISNCFFITTWAHFVFNLRGPPSVICC